MSHAEPNAFLDALHGHQHSFICALDPFTLDKDDVYQRLLHLQSTGATAAIIASTDDEDYDSVVPPLLAYLRGRIRIKIIEHFRPHAQQGFRRAHRDSYVLMTTVANSSVALYAGGVQADGAERQRAAGKLIASRALVFGHDEKSARYVASHFIPDDSVAVLARYLEANRQACDVYYLFSRSRKLGPEMIAAARAIVGAQVPIVVSGCIKNAADIEAALQAGASRVAVGTLLEHENWRERLDALIGCPDAMRRQA
jgi:heptaprenylglyceryl phosphate synthase